jgi:hypothetical protein
VGPALWLLLFGESPAEVTDFLSARSAAGIRPHFPPLPVH